MSSTVIKCPTRTTQGLHVEIFFNWRINNFIDVTRRGYSIVSPIFSSNLYFKDRWQLYWDPRASTIGGENYVGIRLRLISSSEDQIMAQYNFSVINEDGVVDNAIHSRVCQFKAGEFRGCGKFIKCSELQEQQPIIACRLKMFIDEHLENRLARIRDERQRGQRARAFWRKKEARSKTGGGRANDNGRMRLLAQLRRKIEDGTFDMDVVTVENVGGLLRLVIDSNSLDVRRKIFHFIKAHYTKFAETSGYRRIKEHYPEVLTRYLHEIVQEENI